ncbi:HAMP domain-containing sensor histidine kinase [Enhygromyxa salina]|uniref:histidine kinase n=1 Tax=Enhygromyxa salina TaxID=215803 RepID=A0A2S9YFK7_9BACT|nr:HAMP domain-containing sensor histidine kinase [Enhygromyxa salina]PRQ03821.1 Sensor kinase CusS [Enhygromyxa salina]
MQLRSRLLLFGAVVPLALLAAAIVISGVVFNRVLLDEHDRALLAQAGIESLSLFDHAAAPHLHISESPLDNQIREFASRGALYGPDGAAIASYPADAPVPPRTQPAALSTTPTLETVVGVAGHERQLWVRVDAPDGQPHALWLAASLERHDREMDQYWRIAALVFVLVSVVLLTIQVIHAKRLSERVGNLTGHMRRLRAGSLDAAPPPDPGADEIAELRRAIAETTERLAAARSSQDRLIADAAHELRTPLAAMRAGIEIALRRERPATHLRETLEHTLVEVARLTQLSSSLLDLAALRSSPVERSRGDLVPVLVEAVDAARALAEERGCIVRVQHPPEAPAEFSASAVRQALDNLLHNAIKFSPSASEIVVDLRGAGPRWEFAVVDAGPGVPEDAREAVFEPFHRLGRAGPGGGLGLAIVRDVAARHHGRAWVEDAGEAGGARFVLALPRDDHT